MNVEVVEFHYYAVPGPVLLAIGAACLALASAGVALLFWMLKSKR